MYFYSICGGDKIGGSSYFININNRKFLLDMGLDMNTPGVYPKYENLYKEKLLCTMGDLDGVVISHAHLDHIGSLPYILGEGRNVPLYASKETKVLGEKIMLSAPKESDDYIEIFKKGEIIESCSKIKIVDEIKKENYQIKLHDSNHILGSKMVEIVVDEKKLLYTGDFSLKTMLTAKKIKFSELLDVDVLLCEGTNFGKRCDYIAERINFIRHANKIISKGVLLIPAFAMGKTQEILFLIKNAMKNGILKKVPIYIDGLSSEMTDIYENLGIKINVDGVEIKKAPYEFYKKMDMTPKIIIASSGMLLKNSASWNYSQRVLENENSNITFVGYQAKKTEGFNILHSGNYMCKGSVSKFDFSGHGDESEIIKLIDIIRPKKVVFLHRTTKIKEEDELKKRLKDMFGKDILFYFSKDGEGINL